MKYTKILICMAVLVCLAFQAYAQSDPLGESSSGSTMGSSGDYLSPNMGQTYPSESSGGTDQARDEMVGWLNQPVPADATKSAKTATGTTSSPDVTKSTTTTTSSTPSADDATKSTTTTSTTPSTGPTTTTKSTSTTTSTPGFEATFGLIGLLAMTFIALRRRR